MALNGQCALQQDGSLERRTEKRESWSFSDNGQQLSQGRTRTVQSFYQPQLLPPFLPSSFIRVCVGGGALLAVKHLSLLRFGIFFLPISFFPSIDPISCHVSNPAYPSLAQTPLHFISFLPSIPQQIPPASCLLRQKSS